MVHLLELTTYVQVANEDSKSKLTKAKDVYPQKTKIIDYFKERRSKTPPQRKKRDNFDKKVGNHHPPKMKKKDGKYIEKRKNSNTRFKRSRNKYKTRGKEA